jgi:hypothetical protein
MIGSDENIFSAQIKEEGLALLEPIGVPNVAIELAITTGTPM